jgi:hypothetical protein
VLVAFARWALLAAWARPFWRIHNFAGVAKALAICRVKTVFGPTFSGSAMLPAEFFRGSICLFVARGADANESKASGAILAHSRLDQHVAHFIPVHGTVHALGTIQRKVQHALLFFCQAAIFFLGLLF